MTPQEKLSLTPDQEKAFKLFERAFNKCKKSGITFYTVLESVTAFNGEYIDSIHDDKSALDFSLGDPSTPDYNCIMHPDLSGWADDEHFVSFKKK